MHFIIANVYKIFATFAALYNYCMTIPFSLNLKIIKI